MSTTQLSDLPLSIDDPSTEPSESPVSPMTVTPFCAAELQRALTEQAMAFAIKDSVISLTQPDEARASITILEGEEIDVQLTMQGFRIVDYSSSESVTVYETLDNLLCAVSPLYTEKHQEAIVEALSKLSSSQHLNLS